MKKISILFALISFPFLTSCLKNNPSMDGYWYNKKEKAFVEIKDSIATCYFVVWESETYTIKSAKYKYDINKKGFWNNNNQSNFYLDDMKLINNDSLAFNYNEKAELLSLKFKRDYLIRKTKDSLFYKLELYSKYMNDY